MLAGGTLEARVTVIKARKPLRYVTKGDAFKVLGKDGGI